MSKSVIPTRVPNEIFIKVQIGVHKLVVLVCILVCVHTCCVCLVCKYGVCMVWVRSCRKAEASTFVTKKKFLYKKIFICVKKSYGCYKKNTFCSKHMMSKQWHLWQIHVFDVFMTFYKKYVFFYKKKFFL